MREDICLGALTCTYIRAPHESKICTWCAEWNSIVMGAWDSSTDDQAESIVSWGGDILWGSVLGSINAQQSGDA